MKSVIGRGRVDRENEQQGEGFLLRLYERGRCNLVRHGLIAIRFLQKGDFRFPRITSDGQCVALGSF